eukprot:CAMPEP_0114988408 /NCGR_PEP_ID=MMETSP0216-20121206/9577_1 /TAXON_ID=223996 /ORGANISM="Protocruzia adherens, Strain Boccale" /LENGTH=311 /DNA_ID=CAMNT_0002351175 /DNA_START=96 /DNA_END=1031 /DNA_ORIENTATION=+
MAAKEETLRVINSSWYMPNMKKNGREEYSKERIPGSVFFDIDECVDKSIKLPHTYPPVDVFTDYMKALAIGKNSTIVCYDNLGIFTSPRMYWMLKSFGCEDVYVLDGGLPDWKAQGYEVESGDRVTATMDMTGLDFNFGPGVKIRSFEDMVKLAYDVGDCQIVDARPKERFDAAVPEPRPWVSAGRIATSTSMFFKNFWTEECKFKSPEEIKEAFNCSNIDLDKPIVTSCGSGVSACIDWFAAMLAGAKHIDIYDGSWTEFGSRNIEDLDLTQFSDEFQKDWSEAIERVEKRCDIEDPKVQHILREIFHEL